MVERVLIVGYGSIGKRHLRLARELLPAADIRVLRRRPNAEVPQYASSCCVSAAEALAFCPQIAVLANPATMHIPVAQPLVEAGVHLLIEKPLAATVDGVSTLLEACRERRLVLLIGYNLRHSVSLQRFRTLIQEGAAGKVISVRCEVGQYLPDWRPGTSYEESVSARSELGGGVLLELSHEIDYLRWVFGEMERVKATLSRQSGLNVDVEDTAHLTLTFAPDADGRRLSASLNMDFVRRDTTRMCTAICDLGSLRWNGLTGAVERYEVAAREWQAVFRHQDDPDDTYRAEWQHFLRCVTSGETPAVGGEDGLAVMRVIGAARIASDSGCEVSL